MTSGGIRLEEEKKWCVYIHRNMVNDKAYIGITSRKPQERWGNNGSQYHKGNQYAIRAAIDKYGWDNFEHIIWAEDLSENDAKKNIEKLLIALFKTNCCRYYNPSYGYNLTDGGDGTCGRFIPEEQRKRISESLMGNIPWNYGKIMSDEYKRKVSIAHIGLTQSEETKKKRGESISQWWSDPKNREKYSGVNSPIYGEKNHFYGKHHSEEAKEKNRQAHLGRHQSKKTIEKLREISKNKRGVVQLSLDWEFIAKYPSAKAAQRKTGIYSTSIGACCRGKCQGKYKSAGGFRWVFTEDYDQLTQQND